MALTPGSVFAGYLIERRIGHGGMGSVYAARHPRLPRRVALKVLAEGLGSQPEFRARFEREAELAARLDHPNVVAVYDRGIEDEQPWIAMQFVDGVDVDQLVRKGPAVLPPERAVFIIGEAAKGLDHAHRHGLLHRDIKPANILVAEEADDQDKVLVTDFGIARAVDQTDALTSAGSSPSTLPYASPEQIEGRILDHRSDVYSLGCTLYVTLTGLRPYPRDSAMAVMHAHLSDPPPRPTQHNPALPRELDDVIARAMSKNPADRYNTCRQLAHAAAAALGIPITQTAARRSAFPPPPFLSSNPSNPTLVPPPLSDPSAPTVLPVHPSDPRGLTAGTAHPQNFATLPPPPGQAPTGFPSPPPPSRPLPLVGSDRPPSGGGKRWMLIAGGVAAVALVAGIGGFALMGNEGGGPGPVTSKPAPPPVTSAVTSAGPWKAFGFAAKALPTFIPETPATRNYLGDICEPINAQFNKITDLNTENAVVRIRCGESDSDKQNYIVYCNRDRTPISAPRDLDDLPDVRKDTWSRNGSSGKVSYATSTEYGYGIVVVVFDDPSRNFCEVWAYGVDGSTGQQVYDTWFQQAPLGD